MSANRPAHAAILDIDGTLVDTNYHHAVAWFRAFRQHGHVVPLWRIHRHIGMGGDQIVAALLSETRSRSARATTSAPPRRRSTCRSSTEVEPLRGARELMQDLRDRGRPVVLASSAKANEVDHYLDLLDARELADGWTTSADVEPHQARARSRPGRDEEARRRRRRSWSATRRGTARRPSAPASTSLAVLTGGFSEQELLEAGASRVFRSIDELRLELDETPFG